MTATVVSFYTRTWEYPEHAERLSRECEWLGLNHYIIERPDLGGYIANCRQKPNFLLEALRLLDRPILWIDVDGSILAKPVALNYDVDFMARPMGPDRDRKWHVGTLFINATPSAEAFLVEWIETLDAIEGSDEAALDALWREGCSVTTADLPESYFEILMRDAEASEGTVIAHRLSSSLSKAQGR